MDLKQCWMQYLKAERLLGDGHWQEAQRCYGKVLDCLPNFIHRALEDDSTRPCQFSCLLIGLRDATISQSEILNKLGHYQEAFSLLHQNYALMQFLTVEPHDLVQTTYKTIESNSEILLKHMEAFCSAQRDANWLLEFARIRQTHNYFATLRAQPAVSSHHQH